MVFAMIFTVLFGLLTVVAGVYGWVYVRYAAVLELEVAQIRSDRIDPTRARTGRLTSAVIGNILTNWRPGTAGGRATSFPASRRAFMFYGMMATGWGSFAAGMSINWLSRLI